MSSSTSTTLEGRPPLIGPPASSSSSAPKRPSSKEIESSNSKIAINLDEFILKFKDIQGLEDLYTENEYSLGSFVSIHSSQGEISGINVNIQNFIFDGDNRLFPKCSLSLSKFENGAYIKDLNGKTVGGYYKSENPHGIFKGEAADVDKFFEKMGEISASGDASEPPANLELKPNPKQPSNSLSASNGGGSNKTRKKKKMK